MPTWRAAGESFFLPNGTLFWACPSGGKTTAPNCNGQHAFLTMQRADNISSAIAGHIQHMPVRTRLAGTSDPYEAVSAICVNWEVRVRGGAGFVVAAWPDAPLRANASVVARRISLPPPTLPQSQDQNLWVDKRGNFHTLMHAYRGQPCDYPVCDRVRNKTFCSAVGGHAFSRDGRDWDISPVVAYTPTQAWQDGRPSTTFRARERPHLIFGADGQTPTHFINGVGDPCPGGGGGNTGCPDHGGDHTFTLIVPLGSA